MQHRRYVTAGVIIGSIISGVGAMVSLDPLWLFENLSSGYNDTYVYMSVSFYDTARDRNFNRFYPIDTGASYNESQYINFDYQFSDDSMKIYDRYDSSIVIYSDYRPGYAGFKIDWDDGITVFNVAPYRFLLLAHKGPLPEHKITIRFGYNSGCGSPTAFTTLGTVPPSDAWKTDTIVIPNSIRNLTPEEQFSHLYYEMQVLITNIDPDGPPTSPPGNLKIDDICLVDTADMTTIRLRPDPSVKYERTRAHRATDDVRVSVFTTDGRLVKTVETDALTIRQNTNGSSNRYTVSLPRGVYCSIIERSGVITFKKFIHLY